MEGVVTEGGHGLSLETLIVLHGAKTGLLVLFLSGSKRTFLQILKRLDVRMRLLVFDARQLVLMIFSLACMIILLRLLSSL